MLALGLVIARLVVEPNQPAPEAADDAILIVQRHGVYVGGCPTGDAGVGDGGIPDGGSDDGGLDAGVGDAGTGDAGTGDAGTQTCETIEGDAVSLVVNPRFTLDPSGTRFALLFVTENRPIVETVPDPFPELALLSKPEIIVHEVEVPDPALGSTCDDTSGGCGGGNSYDDSGGGCSFESDPYYDPPDFGDGGLGDGGLERVGPYEIVRTQPADKAALAALLDSLGYVYQDADLDAVAPYLAHGYHVVAVRVAIDGGSTKQLDPIQLTWEGSQMRLPVALGDSSTAGLTAYIAADGRYEFPGSQVTFASRTAGGATPFLTAMTLDDLVSTGPLEDPVAAHELGDAEYQEVVEFTKEVRVPVTRYCGDDDDGGGCCRNCNARGRSRYDWALIGVVVGVLLLPRRRRRLTSRR
jgi:hypothetical protein